MSDLYRIDPDRTDRRSNFVAERFTVRDRFGAEVGVLVKVEPTDQYCTVHKAGIFDYNDMDRCYMSFVDITVDCKMVDVVRVTDV